MAGLSVSTMLHPAARAQHFLLAHLTAQTLTTRRLGCQPLEQPSLRVRHETEPKMPSHRELAHRTSRTSQRERTPSSLNLQAARGSGVRNLARSRPTIRTP